MPPLIAAEMHEAFEILPGRADGGLLVLCDHASNAIPPEFARLGLPSEQLERHIAWDIGAADVTRALAAEFAAPAVLSRFSRLVADPNRAEDDPTIVMRLADGAIVPGNARLDAAGIAARVARFHAPYDDAIARTIAAMRATGKNPVIIAMHSFTPAMKGIARPWHATIIWDFDPRLNRPLIEAFQAEKDIIFGENEPYQGGYRGDTIDRHCLGAGLAHALIEIRQDLISTKGDAQAWAGRIARLLRPLLADPILYEARVHGAHP